MLTEFWEKCSRRYRRTAMKALTYRAAVTATSYVVVFALTGNPAIAVAFTGLSIFYSTAIYFIHERVWSHIKWGKNV